MFGEIAEAVGVGVDGGGPGGGDLHSGDEGAAIDAGLHGDGDAVARRDEDASEEGVLQTGLPDERAARGPILVGAQAVIVGAGNEAEYGVVSIEVEVPGAGREVGKGEG